MMFSRPYLSAGAIFVWCFSSLLACDHYLDCGSGEIRYQGRPPREMFAFDQTCSQDCFSWPDHQETCKETCGPVVIDHPAGFLVQDRWLILLDLENLRPERAIVFSFGYIDEALGNAPEHWGFLKTGSATYLSDDVWGTARFAMDTAVAKIPEDGDLLGLAGTVEKTTTSTPGRLEIIKARAKSLVGRFFLGYETNTHQPQGEVVGCFNVDLKPLDRDTTGTILEITR